MHAFRVNDELVRVKAVSHFNMRAEGVIDAPELFAKAYERPVTASLRYTKPLSQRAAGRSDWKAKKRDISMVAFAGDVFRKPVWNGGDGAQGRVEC